jgi:GT2 family glycosyltransferase
MAAQPLVYILLLNYRGIPQTFACLDSLCALDYSNHRIVVIDNASPDDSLTRLKERLQANPDEFRLIESDKNLGFSGGNNLAIKAVLTENLPEADAYIWLLNNDTTVAPEALTHLVTEAQRTGGITGSLLLYPDGKYQQVGTRLNWLTGSAKGYPESAVRDRMTVETLSGASMLIPFKTFHRAGLLDESFFLYFEDGEASLRYAIAGFPLTVATQSKVFHEESATTGAKSLNTQYYYHRNRLRMLMMFANPLQKLTILAYAMFRWGRSIVKSQWGNNPERRVSARVLGVALKDFFRGVSGPCPHNLEDLR